MDWLDVHRDPGSLLVLLYAAYTGGWIHPPGIVHYVLSTVKPR